MIYVLLQIRWCQPGSTSSVTEGVAVHSSDTPNKAEVSLGLF
jgi:Tfp pilus assembly protein PilZ